jgi:hypothetical protein
VELTEIMDSLREKIHLDEVPHFTTIQKFCHRIRSSIFTRLLNRLMKLFYDWGEKIPLYRYRFIRVHQLLRQPLLFVENMANQRFACQENAKVFSVPVRPENDS